MRLDRLVVLGLLAVLCCGFFLKGQEKNSNGEVQANNALKNVRLEGLNALASHAPCNYLPYLKKNDKEDSAIRKSVQSKLALAKVPTIEKAELAAKEYDSEKLHMIGASDGAEVTSLLQLGRRIQRFGEDGDLVWVVQFANGGSKDVIGEVWINARNGEIRSIFPPK